MTSGALLTCNCVSSRKRICRYLEHIKHYLIKFFEEMNNCSANSVLTDYPAWTPPQYLYRSLSFFELGSNSMASWLILFQFLSLTLAKSAQLLSVLNFNLSCSNNHTYMFLTFCCVC